MRTRVNRIEEMYGGSRGNVKVEPSSTFTFLRVSGNLHLVFRRQAKQKNGAWICRPCSGLNPQEQKKLPLLKRRGCILPTATNV